jgi:hypothetical protein
MTSIRGPRAPHRETPTTPAATSAATSPRPSLPDATTADTAEASAKGGADFDLTPTTCSTRESHVPSTSAAPVHIDVAALQQGPSMRRGQALQTRTQAMLQGAAKTTSVAVERFLRDPRVQTVGLACTMAGKDAVNAVAQGASVVISSVGGAADAAALNLVVSGVRVNETADAARDRLLAVAADLTIRGDALVREAEAVRARGGVVSAQKKREAEQAFATGHVLSAVGTHLQTVVDPAELVALCQTGGSLVLRIATGVVDGVAELAHAGLAAVGIGLTFAGRVLASLFGSEALSSVGISVFGGLRAHVGSPQYNAGIGGAFYFPPANKTPSTDGQIYADAVVFNWGVSAATPVVSAGFSDRGGVGAGVNLVFFAASINALTERVFVGIPGVWGVTLGRDLERGSEISVGSAVGVDAASRVGAFATYGVALHTPLLDPVNKLITRPVARAVVAAADVVKETSQLVWRAVRSASASRAT